MNAAAPKGPTWDERAQLEVKRRTAERDHEADRYPLEEPGKPAAAAGYGNTRPAGVDLGKLRQIELQYVATRGKARALDEEAGHHRQDARAHAMAAFAQSLYVPASERFDLASIRGFLDSPSWPARKLAAENISAGDLRQAVYLYELAAMFATAANDAAKEAAGLRELLERLKAHAFPQVSGLIANGGARVI